ncbi:MAG: glycosyltransferase family 4 protein [Methanobacteriota archaeon]|nr:MAG: glycosyltransferase family 4 protein [Euryarchaeota archaeon]
MSSRYEEMQLLHMPSMFSSYLLSPRLLPPDFLIGKTARIMDGYAAREAIRHAELIQVEHPWLYNYAERRVSSNAKVVLSTHNCEYELHRQAASRFGKGRFSLQMVKKAERYALERADLVLAVSKEDLSDFDKELDVDIAHKSVIVPNGVDTTATTPATSGERKAAKHDLGITSENLALFIGSRHAPNVEAIASILRIAGRHNKKTLSIVVVGSAGEGFRDMHNVSFIGHVDDYRPYLRAADVALNPVISGSGTSLKTLEYLAAGIPVISTPFGARGLEIEDGQHVLVSDNSKLEENIDLLISEEDLTRRLSSNGRQLAVDVYDWRIIGSELTQALKRRGLV